MIPCCTHEGVFARLFRERYLRSLDDYRFFYDDLATLGDPSDAEYVVYFVPGINGTPGQIRFVLPSLTHVFGRRLYIKSLHLPEFSARRPTWLKYSLVNVDRKIARLQADLTDLLARHEHVIVIASSNGFYDFAAAAGRLPEDTLRERIHLVWGACAPDHFTNSPWERVFYPFNGFEYDGHRWFAFPNHNVLTHVNPETSHSHLWRDGLQHRRFRKADLESRFRLLGLEWDYISTSQLGGAVNHVVRQIQGPLPCPTWALVASHDGYWQGRPRDMVERTIRRYVPAAHLSFQPTSHLWVVTPSYVTALLREVKHDLTNSYLPTLSADCSPRGRRPTSEVPPWAAPANVQPSTGSA